jgi:hypothetical protein
MNVLLGLLPAFLQEFIAETSRPAAAPKLKHYNKPPTPPTPEQRERVAAYYKVRGEHDRTRQKVRATARRAMLQRQHDRELSGFYDGTISVASAIAAQGSGKRMRRHKKDPTGKRRSNNLVRVW